MQVSPTSLQTICVATCLVTFIQRTLFWQVWNPMRVCKYRLDLQLSGKCTPLYISKEKYPLQSFQDSIRQLRCTVANSNLFKNATFPVIHGACNYSHCVEHKGSHYIPSLEHINHAHFNIILPSAPRSRKWSLTFRLPEGNFIMCHMLRP